MTRNAVLGAIARIGVPSGLFLIGYVATIELGRVATGIAIAAIASAAGVLGTTLVWQAYKGYSDALKEADPLPEDQRRSFRADVRGRRKVLGAALALLTTASVTAVLIGSILKERDTPFDGSAIWFAAAAAALSGLGLVVTHSLWRLYFAMEDFLTDVRDHVRAESERTKLLARLVDAPPEATKSVEPRPWKVVAR